MVARGLAYLGGCAFILLLLSATGVLDVFTRGFGGGKSSSSTRGIALKAAPGSGHRWRELHAAQLQDLRSHDAEGLQVIWYGDDLVESWRGSAGGGPCPACEGIPDVWGRHFGSPWLAQAYGIAGDQTANLLWRMQKGLRPQRQPPVQILYIGASDLDAAFADGGEAAAQSAAPGVVTRIEESVKLLHPKEPNGRILLLALLPRAPAGGTAAGNASAGTPWPTPLAAGIAGVNKRLEALSDRYPAAHYVDCGSALLTTGGLGQQLISEQLVPGGRQPAPEGMHRLGLCLDSLVHHLVMSAPPIDMTVVDEEDDPTPEKPENLQMRYVEEGKPDSGPAATAADAGGQAAAAAGTAADTAAATGAGAVAGAADTVVQPQVQAAATVA